MRAGAPFVHREVVERARRREGSGPRATRAARPTSGGAGRVRMRVRRPGAVVGGMRSSRYIAPGMSTYSRSGRPSAAPGSRRAARPCPGGSGAGRGEVRPSPVVRRHRPAGLSRPGSVTHSRRQTRTPSQHEAPHCSEYQTRVVPTASWVTPSARRTRGGVGVEARRPVLGAEGRVARRVRHVGLGPTARPVVEPAARGWPGATKRPGHAGVERHPAAVAVPRRPSPDRPADAQLDAVVLHAGQHECRRCRGGWR